MGIKSQKGNSLDKEIARLVVLAQAASDSGKGLYRIKMRDPELAIAIRLNYQAKSIYEKKAISLINKTQSSWRYWVNRNGIVYFEYKNIQISFHNPRVNLSGYRNKGTPTKWTKWTGGSISGAYALIKEFAL